jgi:predicted nucleic-acid-binding Zn-ribbon protein
MPHEWRKHPALQGRLRREHPDDLQVIVHDGGPRLSDRKPELVWVTITVYDGEVFSGKVLNQPEQLETVSKDEEIYFVVPKCGEYPIHVTKKYLDERSDWIIHPCQKCGLTELFDAPSDLMKAVFPALPDGAVTEAFTTLCGMCGGVQLIQHKDAVLEEPRVEESPRK